MKLTGLPKIFFFLCPKTSDRKEFPEIPISNSPFIQDSSLQWIWCLQLEIQGVTAKSHLPSLLQTKDENYASGICFPSWSYSVLATKHKERGEENNYDLNLGKD